MASSDPTQPGAARNAHAHEAAKQSVTQERLLEGEEKSVKRAQEVLAVHGAGHKSAILLEDAIHWRDVYGELLDFKRFMIDGARVRLEKMSAKESRQEIEVTDIAVALVESERFARRLAYWSSKVSDYS